MKVTLEKLKEVFRKEVDRRIDVYNFDPDESITIQGVDSLDRSSVFLALEEDFDVKFSDEDISNLETYNKILEFINSKS